MFFEASYEPFKIFFEMKDDRLKTVIEVKVKHMTRVNCVPYCTIFTSKNLLMR